MRTFLCPVVPLLVGLVLTPLAGCAGENDGPDVGTGYITWSGRPLEVTYEIRDGAAFVGGDMRFELSEITSEPPEAGARLAPGGSGLWPSRRIPYRISIPAGDPRRGPVEAAIAVYNQRTTVQLVPRWSETDFIDFVPTTARYSSSGVGYSSGAGAHVVSMATGAKLHDALHEIAHRIGIFHELQRTDRDVYLDMYTPGNPRGLPNYHCSNGHRDASGHVINPASPHPDSVYDSDHCAPFDVNFGIVRGLEGAGPLDTGSIMMYVPTAGGLEDASGTLLTNPLTGLGYCTMLKRGTPVAPDTFHLLWNAAPTLSAQDIASISSLYPSEPTRVGSIDLGGACPEGRGHFFTDDEDSGNATQARAKLGHAWDPVFERAWPTVYSEARGVYPAPQGTRIDFCRETVPRLPALRGDYAVLRLSAQCPVGSFAFRRISDNENSGNINSSSGGIAPSTQNRSPEHGVTAMELCFVPGTGEASTTTVPPWRASGRGAFTNAWTEYPGCNDFHWHLQDDENAGANDYFFPPETQPFASRIMAVVGGGPNTEYIWNTCRR